MIEVNNVTVNYILGDIKDLSLKEFFIRKMKREVITREFCALKDISFHVNKGELLGIIGSNGSGKSTILKVLSGIMQPSKGSISIKGMVAPILELGAGFDGEMTVKENIFLRGALLGYQKEFILEKYGDIIEFSELKEFENVAYNKLSSGMKSKLAFALSSFVTPDVLILDEVLSVGDMAFRKKSEKRMKELFASGVTTILVSHSLNQIREMCSSVLWLEKGEKKGMGNTKEICDDYEKYMQKK
ncbi:MAG: ABC transporter ATP-binding protein [Lachnospiraceae bacterium]|jgi:ABC-2 type transport system ATP-binding protein|nr:ABC transporter ATP-binding protein [Lachnospiraceae bacterium]